MKLKKIKSIIQRIKGIRFVNEDNGTDYVIGIRIPIRIPIWTFKNYDYENKDATAMGMIMPYPDLRRFSFNDKDYEIVRVVSTKIRDDKGWKEDIYE